MATNTTALSTRRPGSTDSPTAMASESPRTAASTRATSRATAGTATAASSSPSRCFAVGALLGTDGMAARGAALGLCWENRKLGVRLAAHGYDLREYGHAVNDAIVALYGWSMPRVRAVGSMALAHVLEQVPTEDEVDEAEGFFEVLAETRPA